MFYDILLLNSCQGRYLCFMTFCFLALARVDIFYDVLLLNSCQGRYLCFMTFCFLTLARVDIYVL